MGDNSLGFGVPSDLPALIQIARLMAASGEYKPWLNMPVDGKAFDKLEVIDTPDYGDPETIVTRLTCPTGYNGIVKRISNNFLGGSFNPGLPSLIWRIRNGVAISSSSFVDNYSRIVIEFGTTNYPRESDGIFLVSDQTLLYTVENNDPVLPAGGTSQVACCFAGFFWPAQRRQ